jgi:asparagine synthase (glutamine-hydrolysing)
MCGIVGWVDYENDPRGQRSVIEDMTETMRLRGPDDGGTWVDGHAALGHRRLAVIDIDGGKQPMVAGHPDPHRGPAVLVYSGEIYNYLELRAELADRGHRFETRSDTEVLLRSYQEWGTACVERLNGMFAFAVWDAARQVLVLARDRIGVKPLYYVARPHGALFASEPKGLLAHPDFSPVVDESALPILLNSRLGLPGETPLRGMREVPPGHVVEIDRSGCRETQYWSLTSVEHTDDLPTTVDTVRDLMQDIVRRQLVADVPLSSMLSGGLDSTLLSCLAAGEFTADGRGPLRTYCVEFDGDAEHFSPTELRPEIDAPYAAVAAQRMGSDHVPVVLRTGALLDALPAARAARDLPSLGQFDTSMYLLFRRMREHSTVALSAEAADEFFGGYPWYHDPAMVERDGFPWLGDAPRLADCLAPDVRARVRPAEAERDRYRTLLNRVPRLAGEDGVNARMREVLYLSMQRPLQYLLDRKDRMSMAVGLEVRVPYCDHRLVEYAWNIPWEMKVADGRWKSPLRMAARGIVPDETLNRPKSGYPGTHDPQYERDVLGYIDKMVEDRSSPLHGLFDIDRINDIRAGGKTMTWLNAAHLLLPLLEIDVWMRTYGIRLA